MFSLKGSKGTARRYVTIRTRRGKHRRLLILQPPRFPENGTAPGVLWIHGGGYATGVPEMALATRAADLASKGGAVVISPAYTLSWKEPYPAALEDCYDALLYIKENADVLGIRSDQIMVGGESAGGGLAAALCMLARDRGSVGIAFHMPLYPMLDCFDTDSSRDNHGKVWNTRRNHLAWRLYLRGIKNAEEVPVYASPSRQKDFAGLPPCYTFVGDIEPFLDETLEYVRNLKEAGVPAEADVFRGFYHAYDVMQPYREDAERAAEEFLKHFRYACEHYHAAQPI